MIRREGQTVGRQDNLVIDRRSLLYAAAMFSAAAASPILAQSARPKPYGIRFVIVDKRFPQSLEFGRLLIGHGAEALEVADGLTSLWQDRLRPHWKNRQGIVAGLTTRPIWDGLSEQAQNQFRKPRLIGRHSLNGSLPNATHRITTPHIVSHRLDLRGLDTVKWPFEMAQLVLRCAAADSACGNDLHVGLPLPMAQFRSSLLSWIIV